MDSTAQIACAPEMLRNIGQWCSAANQASWVKMDAYAFLMLIASIIVFISYWHYTSAFRKLLKLVNDPDSAADLLSRMLMRRGGFLFAILGFLLLLFGVKADVSMGFQGAYFVTGAPGAALCLLSYLLYRRAGTHRVDSVPDADEISSSAIETTAVETQGV